jgi:PKD repeat protein
MLLGEGLLFKKNVSGTMLTLLIGSVLFSAILLVRGEIVEHDLIVSWQKPIISERTHLKNGTSTALNATVFNNGTNVENVILQLLINGTYVLNSSTLNLAPGDVFWSAYYWTPEDGDYCVTAYTPPVENETHTDNNNDTKSVRVCPNQPPIPHFTYSPPPPPPGPIKNENVSFDASASYDPDWGNITVYSWNFSGTIINRTVPNATYKFTTPGNKTVTLTLHDTEGETNSTSKELKVHTPPVAHFDILGEPYVDHLLTFNALYSYDPDGTIVGYVWDFGDGANDTGMIVYHAYADDGNYTVTLTVTDHDSLNDSYAESITIGSGTPTADFEIIQPRPYYVNETLTFDASKSNPDGGAITSYFWNWDDGTNKTGKIVPHTFEEARIYNVTLTVIDEKGLNDSISKNVPVIFHVLLEVTNSTGGKTVTANPSHGTFNISITIAHVVDLDYFDFTLKYPSGIPPPLLEGIRIYHGDFWLDEKTIADAQGQIRVNSTVHIGGIDGNYTLAIINFKVTNPGNCTLVLSKWELTNSTGNEIVSVVTTPADFYTTQPVANFTYLPRPVMPDRIVTLNASLSYDPDNPYDGTPGPITDYTWDFGDGTNGMGMITNHTFASGVFSVNLTVTDDDGESSWITSLVCTRNVTLHVKPCELAFNDTSSLYETAGTLPISVNVTNNGELTETFTVKLYANDTIIGIQNKTILGGKWEYVNFTLNTEGLQKGNYSISAHVAGIIKYTDHLVRVHLTGDVDHDGDVDIYDIVKMCEAYGSIIGDSEYEVNVDLDCDGDIDLYDLVIVCSHYGEKDP